jgi:hypothetical protein
MRQLIQHVHRQVFSYALIFKKLPVETNLATDPLPTDIDHEACWDLGASA